MQNPMLINRESILLLRLSYQNIEQLDLLASLVMNGWACQKEVNLACEQSKSAALQNVL